LLEDVTDASAGPGDRLAIKQHAASGWQEQAGENVQKCAFATSRWPDQARELILLQIE
jgi:hypothetical protein